MIPNADTIARMEARGWIWDAAAGRFRARGGDVRGPGLPLISGIIYGHESVWYATYGVIGILYGDVTQHDTPESAADEAEAWFRQVVTGLPGVKSC